MPSYSVAWSPLHPLLLLAKGPLLGQSWDIYEIPNGPKHLAFSPDVGGKSEPFQHILDLVMAVPKLSPGLQTQVVLKSVHN